MTDDRTDITRADGSELPDDGFDKQFREAFDEAGLDLIIDYLNDRLPPERIAEVKRRLAEDAAFRELAAPLVAAWTVPPDWKLDPMPRAEVVKSWDELTRRAGFTHQRQRSARRRRRWIIRSAVVAAIGVGGWIATAPIRRAISELGDMVPVADSGGNWMTVGKTRVKLEPGAKLLYTKAPLGLGDMMQLEGAARFVFTREPLPADSAELKLTGHAGVGVMTSAGIVSGMNGDFRVDARPDATEVEVFPREKRPAHDRDLLAVMPDLVAIAGMRDLEHRILLGEGEIGRVELGAKPVKLRVAPDSMAWMKHPMIRAIMKEDSARKARNARRP